MQRPLPRRDSAGPAPDRAHRAARRDGHSDAGNLTESRGSSGGRQPGVECPEWWFKSRTVQSPPGDSSSFIARRSRQPVAVWWWCWLNCALSPPASRLPPEQLANAVQAQPSRRAGARLGHAVHWRQLPVSWAALRLSPTLAAQCHGATDHETQLLLSGSAAAAALPSRLGPRAC